MTAGEGRTYATDEVSKMTVEKLITRTLMMWLYMVMVCFGSGTEAAWLGMGKDHGLG